MRNTSRMGLENLRNYATDIWSNPSFLPSFSVRRQVMLDDGVAENVHRKLKRELKFGGQKIHGYIVSPEELCLVTIEQQTLIRQMRTAGIKPYPGEEEKLEAQVEALAGSIQLGLSKLLQNTPVGLELELGGPNHFQEGKAIGAAPLGWKGYGMNYPRHVPGRLSQRQLERAEIMSPNALLAAEKHLCLGTIAASFSQKKQGIIDVSPLVSVPHIAFVARKAPLKESKLQQLLPVLGDILPSTLTLADPVIYLQLERGQEPHTLPTWPRVEIDGRLRLVAG